MKLLMVLMLSLATGAGFAQTSPIRFTTGGYVQGSQQGNVLSFKGIPYAKPPVGDWRWKPPQAPGFSKVLIQATAFGHKCVQPTFDALGEVTGAEGSEDCLNLNVWTPAGAAPGSLPVLFFIHGGNYLNGSASDLPYDGAYLSEHGPAVVVTFDYRLGAFGFLAHRTMAGESGQKGFGNYGALDAIAALLWVKYNIARFGGDPARVMMFGHSAGAFMSCAIMATPMARDLQLFSRVIMESGGCTVYERKWTEAMGDTLATNLGCADAKDIPACLRNPDKDARLVATALKPSALAGCVRTSDTPPA